MVRKTRGFINRWSLLLVTAVLSFGQTSVGLRADDGLLPEARRERGTVRWYTALNINGSKPLADAFEKKYPFLKVAINRLSNERIMNRIFAEAKSGAPQFDVTSFAYLPLLAEKGLLARYQSPQTKSYLEGFFDPKGHWATMYSNLILRQGTGRIFLIRIGMTKSAWIQKWVSGTARCCTTWEKKKGRSFSGRSHSRKYSGVAAILCSLS
jgi:hypothetical protein